MAQEKNFLLLSLDDDDAKNIANILSNKSCSKILDLLTKEELTESVIAEKLKLPISTVHYNLQQLLKAKLITWENYHYSKKGKQVKHYMLANKYIIIAPKGKSSNFLDVIKNLIPVSAIIAAGGFLTHFFTTSSRHWFTKSFTSQADAFMINEMYLDSAPLIVSETRNLTEPLLEPSSTISLFSQLSTQAWPWFILGAIISLGAYFLVIYIRNKLKKK
jgi:predicted transcriptional regulator